MEEFFKRGVREFIDPEGLFRKKLQEKITGQNPKEIIIKFGIDPTRSDIHLGHAFIFRKLRQLQDWGCKVVFLVGDFTAQIGDPTGRSKTRPEMEQKEIEGNMKTYLLQLEQILRTDPGVFSWIRNSDWFTSVTDISLPSDYKVNLQVKQAGSEINVNIPPNSFVGKAIVFEKSRMQISNLGLKDKVSVITLRSFLWALRRITFSRLIEREMFQERVKKGERLYMHEVMYPVLQGIDSQVLYQAYGNCDLEIGGSDQLFNMIVGRDMMGASNQSPQSVLAVSLLTGLDGKEKMSKSLNNYVAITEAPFEMFSKIMSIPDSLILEYFTLCTYSSLSEIKKIAGGLKEGKEKPRDLKLRLAQEIVSLYHGKAKAEKSKDSFLETFQKKKAPEDLKTIKVKGGELLSEILLKGEVVKSKSEFRRLVTEGAVSDILKKEKISDPEFKIESDSVFKIGKKRFLKVSVES
ncbi:MAG: tyrosyl-tRNA synthetase [Parcubacteria group bacterium Gr01-1014_107]|nr:MAG: tyrosyl-tRNA synthetase [Parcubacteria group bacterium Gr01-1014_107]